MNEPMTKPIPAKSPWHLKTRAWQQWPHRMRMYERIGYPDITRFAPALREGPAGVRTRTIHGVDGIADVGEEHVLAVDARPPH